MLLLVVSSVVVVVVLLASSKKDLSRCRTSTTEQEEKPSYKALPKVMAAMRVINVFPFDRCTLHAENTHNHNPSRGSKRDQAQNHTRKATTFGCTSSRTNENANSCRIGTSGKKILNGIVDFNWP